MKNVKVSNIWRGYPFRMQNQIKNVKYHKLCDSVPLNAGSTQKNFSPMTSIHRDDLFGEDVNIKKKIRFN